MLLLSIHPEYANAILDGRKTIELRKQVPRISSGDWAAIYATVPAKQLVGMFRVSNILVTSPAEMWTQVQDKAQISQAAYDEYFADKSLAVGIVIQDIQRFVNRVSLGELRDKWPGFHPPQGFQYLSESQQELVLQLAPRSSGIHKAA